MTTDNDAAVVFAAGVALYALELRPQATSAGVPGIAPHDLRRTELF